ncbi:serine hydrolase [Phenylobacterium sp.]|uniref:serine hydrolase n=1 Tax=Phenylobacterium sp. TaxID=1871053 RepID=UPI00272FE4BF|nr:serine hydrolase [Phenylobacterium sp.]MDP1617419.1 serine hydrolase [Phenylobacterium sp.]
MSGEPTIVEARAARDAAQGRGALAQRRLAVRMMAGTLGLMALGAALLIPPPAAPGAGEQAMASWSSLRFPEPPPQAPSPLVQRIAELGVSFNGRAGIAVRDLESGWTAAHDGDALYPQQSVSKLWVAISVLNAVDQGALTLDDPVIVRRDDLSIFHQPIREHVGRQGYQTTVGALLESAATRSDNAANDVLMRLVGGPDQVRAVMTEKALGAISLGDEERYFQTRIAGLDWRPEFSFGRSFWDARAAMPQEVRRQALEAYLQDPADGASPQAVVAALHRLQAGELLSPQSTGHLLGLMGASQTGPKRLGGGLAEGWRLAHKTGTGQVMGARATGYNDVGLLTAPDGRTYAVAVLIADTEAPIPERQALMQAVTRAVIEQHQAASPLLPPDDDFALEALETADVGADLSLRSGFPAPSPRP